MGACGSRVTGKGDLCEEGVIIRGWIWRVITELTERGGSLDLT